MIDRRNPMKKIILLITLFFAALYGLTACSSEKAPSSQKAGLKIVAVNFAAYDFARQIVKDNGEITMLLRPGSEAHSYEPSPKDIQAIQNSDLFIYTGGDSDDWAEKVLHSMEGKKPAVFKMTDAVTLREEEITEGMTEDHHHHDDEEHHHEEDKEHHHDDDKEHHHDDKEHHHDDKEHHHDEEPELDEHVWTSPKNAVLIVQALEKTLSSLDKEKESIFKKNTDEYVEKLNKLTADFQEVIDSAKRKEIIVGDRFPFLYFVKDFGLTYYAAFPGCATETEANPATVAFLIDKVKEDQIPVVFHIELSDERMSRSIAEATGAKNELLNAVHNISDAQFKAGITYIDLMEHNVMVLKEALN